VGPAEEGRRRRSCGCEKVEGNRKSVEENVSICKKVEKNDNGEREQNRKVDEKKRRQ
jgi:hypothetical protein